MKSPHAEYSPNHEINFREFLRRVWRHKFLFLASLIVFVALGIAYLKIIPPTYKATTTILIDPSSTNRYFGESQYMDGGMGLVETEKNLFNEMNILKSVNIVEQSLVDLDFKVSYHTKTPLLEREHYQDFPYEVELMDESRQLLNTELFIQPISSDSYRIKVEASEYSIEDPVNNKVEFHENLLTHSAIYRFGSRAQSDMYDFIVHKRIDSFPADEFLNKQMFFTVHHLDDLVNLYRSKLDIAQVDVQASVIEVSAKGNVVQKEIDFLDQLTSNYIDTKIEDRNKIATSKESFIKEQLASISDSLSKAERSLEIFRREANAVNLTQSGMHALDKFQELQSKQAQAQLNLKYYRSLLEYLQDSNGVHQIIAPSVVGINDALLNENLLELKRLSTDRTRMSYLKGPKSYDLEILDKQIVNTRAALEENVRNLIASSQMALNDHNTRISTLERTIDLLPSSEKKLINYQRKTKLYENLYNYLNQELAKTGIARAEDLPDITTLNHARMVGDGPVAPHPLLILLLSALLGLLLPTSYVALKGEDDVVLSGVKMLEASTDIPILAQIAADPEAKKSDTIVATHWQAKESLRDLHANIKFFMPDYWQKVTAITSTVPGEGKTFTAANLALSMASAGNDVLLIDADFRNPQLSKHLGIKPTQNLSSYLNGWVTHPSEIIQNHDKYPKLDFITTHAATTNPHRLIQNPRFEFLVLSLKDEYDHIILDCPAVGLVSDYLLMSHLVDIHLFVMKHKVSKASYVEGIEKFKAKGKIENLYLVLNGVPGKQLKHGYFSYDSDSQEAPQKSAIRRSISA